MEIYVSTDGETDGPIPGVYSMLSIGSAAYLPDKTLHGGFTANLETLPGAQQHPDTMKWWKTQPAQVWVVWNAGGCAALRRIIVGPRPRSLPVAYSAAPSS